MATPGSPNLPRHIEYRAIDQILPAARNAKGHDNTVIAGSIDRLGFLDPILRDDRTGKLIDGHGRLYRLREMEAAGVEPPDQVQATAAGWKIPVVTGWASRDDAEAEAAAVAIQPKDGRYNERTLYQVLHRQNTLDGLGFGDDDVADIGRRIGALANDTPLNLDGPGDLPAFDPSDPGPSEPAGRGKQGDSSARRSLSADDDDVPDDAPGVTVLGDWWQLGKHRLLCGDSTKRDTYQTLLEGKRPDLLLTDPPYGVGYQAAGSKKRAILGDLSQATIPVSLACSLDHLHEDGRLVVFGGSDQFAMYLNLFDHHLRQQPRVVVWVKEGFVLRHHGFHSQFELAYYGWKGTGGNIWFGDRTVSDVWAIPRKKDTGHDTEKPVALFEIPVGRLVGPGGLVLDPFAGSGVTIIAAERLGRVAAVIEKDPHWCDVICKRWQAATGVVPVRGATGEPVDFLAVPVGEVAKSA
jgi:DNA modification methylase